VTKNSDMKSSFSSERVLTSFEEALGKWQSLDTQQKLKIHYWHYYGGYVLYRCYKNPNFEKSC